MTASVGRRSWLRVAGLGAGSLVLPRFLPFLSPGAGRAFALEPVRRLVVMVTPQQMMPQAWLMRQGRPDGAAFSYDLGAVPDAEWSKTLAPLAPFKRQVVAIEGMSLYSGIPSGGGEVNFHDSSTVNLLTGAGLDANDKQRALGPSVDQVIAAAVSKPGQLRSLELGSNIYLGGVVNLAADQRAPLIESPLRAVARVFPETQPGALPSLPAERERIAAARATIATFVRGEYQRLAPRLGSEGRAQFEQHAQLLVDIEARLAPLADRTQCRAPTELFPETETENRTRFEMFARITAAALACDRTRVVTIQARQLFNRDFGAPPGDVHEDFAHQAGVDDNAAEQMARFNGVYGGYFAYLLGQLAQIKEGTGTLLDSCLVVWMNEHGLTRIPHTMTEAPVVLAGGGAGRIRTGRYLSVARATPHPMTGAPVGTPHSHLLVSLMRAMGLSTDEIGLPEVRTAGGPVVSLRGPLSDLA